MADYRSIFTRALGLNTMLAAAPERQSSADEFVRNYYRYADQMFQCRQSQVTFTDIDDDELRIRDLRVRRIFEDAGARVGRELNRE